MEKGRKNGMRESEYMKNELIFELCYLLSDRSLISDKDVGRDHYRPNRQ